MSIWQALGFMLLGGMLVGAFNLQTWMMYQRGKREGLGWKRRIQNRQNNVD